MHFLLTFGLLLSALVATHHARAQSAEEFTISDLPGLEAGSNVVRDQYGIAHIRATNEHDLYFMQGYVHAQDRLFQMDVSRHRANGTLGELLGEAALSDDVNLRTFGLRRASEESLQALSERTRAALAAYAQGVNVSVLQNGLPPEYAALELTRFDGWSALDSVAVAKLIAFGLSFNISDIDRSIALEGYIEAGEQLGFDGRTLYFDDLFRDAPFDPAATVPDAEIPPGAALALPATRSGTGQSVQSRSQPPRPDAGAVRLGKDFLRSLRSGLHLGSLIASGNRPASNEWAVAGDFTANGYPLIANDPHLILGQPSTFYPNHLRAGDIDVFGSSFPGAPFVIVGNNRSLAWGATINPLDVVDFYQEQVEFQGPVPRFTLYQGQREQTRLIFESYRVNQPNNGVMNDLVAVSASDTVPPATVIVPRRNNGPLIALDFDTGEALSAQYTGFGPTRELDAFMWWNNSKNLEAFEYGLRFFDFGSINWVVADTESNIAYWTSAEMPLREDLQAGTVRGLPPNFIRSGLGGNEWLPVQNPQPGQRVPYEILPADEMPHLINPAAGWFVNANNDPAGLVLDNDAFNQLRPGGGIYYLNSSYGVGIRAGRITELLQEKLATGDRKISFEEMQEMQADVVLGDAQLFVPYLVNAFENARRARAHPRLAAFDSGNDRLRRAVRDRLRRAVRRLQNWDFSTPTGIPQGYDASDQDGERSAPSAAEHSASIAATIYEVWRRLLVANTVDATLARIETETGAEPESLSRPGADRTVRTLQYLLENFDTGGGVGASGLDFFAVEGVPNAADRRDIVLLQSLAETLELLASDAFAAAFGNSRNLADFEWGKLHRVTFTHPLGEPFSTPPAAGAFPAPLPGLSGIPADGGYETLDRAVPVSGEADFRTLDSDAFIFEWGAVNRYVAEVRPDGVGRVESIWPGGTSGVPGSPYYVNQLPLWLTNDTIPLEMDRSSYIIGAPISTLYVPPEPGGNAGQ